MNKKLYESFINEQDIELLHTNIIKVLTQIGIKFEYEPALEYFVKHGFKTDGDLVFITEKQLFDSLKTVPQTFNLWGYNGNEVTVGVTEDNSSVIAPGNGCDIVQDFDGKYRRTTTADVVNFMKLHDTSDVVDIVSLQAMDSPGIEGKTENTLLSQISLMLKYSHKPIFSPILPTLHNCKMSVSEGIRKGINICREFYGVDDKMVLYTGCCVLSPLTVSKDVLEYFMTVIKENQPLHITCCSMTNLTAPCTLMGSIVQDCANELALVVLSQLINPGSPVILTDLSGTTDMRTVQLCIGSPEFSLMAYAHMALAKYYKIPTRSAGALSDSIDTDYQASCESTIGLMTALLSDDDIVPFAAGVLGSFNILSYSKYILDEEVIRYILRLKEGLDISDKKSMFNQLIEIGPRGYFMAGRTPKEYRQEHLLPKIFNRAGSTEDVRENLISLTERSKKEYKNRIESYALPELDKSQKILLNQFLPERYECK